MLYTYNIMMHYFTDILNMYIMRQLITTIFYLLFEIEIIFKISLSILLIDFTLIFDKLFLVHIHIGETPELTIML